MRSDFSFATDDGDESSMDPSQWHLPSEQDKAERAASEASLQFCLLQQGAAYLYFAGGEETHSSKATTT